MFADPIKASAACAEQSVKPMLLLLLLWQLSLTAMAQSASEPVAAGDSQPTLRLDRALALAVNNDDPALQRLQSRADALRQQAVADMQLPDPEITGSLANVELQRQALERLRIALDVRECEFTSR